MQTSSVTPLVVNSLVFSLAAFTMREAGDGKLDLSFVIFLFSNLSNFFYQVSPLIQLQKYTFIPNFEFWFFFILINRKVHIKAVIWEWVYSLQIIGRSAKEFFYQIIFPAGVDIDTRTSSVHGDICICEKGSICILSGTRELNYLTSYWRHFWLWQSGLQISGELNAPTELLTGVLQPSKGQTGWYHWTG